uniref:Calcineurin-like phosphoesterase domain containing 1 n=1 Tax=Neogobius melanostomus TaxID=47308 RepID=A0A8C6SCY0_9GOBI
MRKRISRRSTGYCLSEGRLINFKEKAYAEGHWRAPSVHPGRGPAAGADEGVASGRLRRRRRRMGRRSGADQRAVEAVNRLQPRPRFMVLCGDLVHAMPGVKAVFSGHYHRNAGGCHDGLDMVVSSAIGCQLGEDAHGLRVVAVTERGIVHRYFSLEQLRTKGMDEDLKKLLEG